jgi:hypothetical protein
VYGGGISGIDIWWNSGDTVVVGVDDPGGIFPGMAVVSHHDYDNAVSGCGRVAVGCVGDSGNSRHNSTGAAIPAENFVKEYDYGSKKEGRSPAGWFWQG